MSSQQEFILRIVKNGDSLQAAYVNPGGLKLGEIVLMLEKAKLDFINMPANPNLVLPKGTLDARTLKRN